MPLLKTINPEDATGSVKEAYDYFMDMAGMIPLPLKLLSVSPNLLSNYIDRVKHYLNESNPSDSLLAHIRLLVAKEENYPYCVNINQVVLEKLCGLDRKSIDAAMVDETQACLEPKEVKMLQFVINAIKDPAITQKSDISRLHDVGWTDKDIFEAYEEGLHRVIRGMAFKAFKMNT